MSDHVDTEVIIPDAVHVCLSHTLQAQSRRYSTTNIVHNIMFNLHTVNLELQLKSQPQSQSGLLIAADGKMPHEAAPIPLFPSFHSQQIHNSGLLCSDPQTPVNRHSSTSSQYSNLCIYKIWQSALKDCVGSFVETSLQIKDCWSKYIISSNYSGDVNQL